MQVGQFLQSRTFKKIIRFDAVSLKADHQSPTILYVLSLPLTTWKYRSCKGF